MRSSPLRGRQGGLRPGPQALERAEAAKASGCGLRLREPASGSQTLRPSAKAGQGLPTSAVTEDHFQVSGKSFLSPPAFVIGGDFSELTSCRENSFSNPLVTPWVSLCKEQRVLKHSGELSFLHRKGHSTATWPHPRNPTFLSRKAATQSLSPSPGLQPGPQTSASGSCRWPG